MLAIHRLIGRLGRPVVVLSCLVVPTGCAIGGLPRECPEGHRCVPVAADAAAPSDATPAGDAGSDPVPDASANDAGSREDRCGDGRDGDLDGEVDEGCGCDPLTERQCYPHDAGSAGVGACARGVQRCEATSEFGTWGPCLGAVAPAAEACDGSIDDDCDGAVDEGCDCAVGARRSCYGGPGATVGVGSCVAGEQQCIDDGTGWSDCVDDIGPREESCNGADDDCDGAVDEELGTVTCGVGECARTLPSCFGGRVRACLAGFPSAEECNGLDDDCDGAVDEDCGGPCFGAPTGPWESHTGEPVMCFGIDFPHHGAIGEYDFATIPDASAPGWMPHSTPTLSFDEPSAMCGTSCSCTAGGDFAYFQTYVEVPLGRRVADFVLTADRVDDGIRVTLFNSRYPAGITPPGAFVFYGGGSTSNLGPYLSSGSNRLVLTHVDDCCGSARLSQTTMVLDGTLLEVCP